MLLLTIIQMISYVIDVITWIVIIQFILGMLIAFNVVNTRNDAVVGIYRGLNALLDPILNPIRRLLPQTGMMDFSPLVLIVLLKLLTILLGGLVQSGF